MAKRIYLYRLDVTYPPESLTDPEWEPPGNWRDVLTSRGTYHHGIDAPFAWPTANKRYLSRTGATTRAQMLEALGAKVTIIRSLPVEWPEPGDG